MFKPAVLTHDNFTRPARARRTAAQFVATLPDIGVGSDFRHVVEAIISAHRDGRPVILGIGAQVIKSRLGPVLIDLMRRGVVKAAIMSATAAFHDFELALTGTTSDNLVDGIGRETVEQFDRAVQRGLDQPTAGLASLLAWQLLKTSAAHRDRSVLVSGQLPGTPISVHVAPDSDRVLLSRLTDCAALERARLNDSQLFPDLSGGVYLQLTAPDTQLQPPGMNGQAFTLAGPDEILIPLLAQAVVDRLESPPEKVVDWDRLLTLREGWRAAGLCVVWTNGCFDLLHTGHLDSLRSARALGDILVVGVNSDVSVRQLKGPTRPIVAGPQRAELLAGLECVDHVVLFDELTPEASLARLKPDVHCKGADYAPPHGKPIPEAAIVEAYGGRLAFLPMRPATSTTDLVDRILQLVKG